MRAVVVSLPLLATLANFLFAALLCHLPHRVKGQNEIPVLGEASIELLTQDNACLSDDSDENVCLGEIPMPDFVMADRKDDSSQEEPADDDEDPMLKQMPTVDFKAYVRADVSSFYQEEAGSRVEQEPAFKGQAGKFVNMSPEPVALYWDAGFGNQGRLISYLGPWASGGTATFPSHQFFITKRSDPSFILCRFRVLRGTSVYYYDPYESKEDLAMYDPARGLLARNQDGTLPLRSPDSLESDDREQYDALKYNREFAALYKDFTGGQEWLSMYPRSPPRHKMWRADYYGQEHTVQTRETQFVDLPPADELGSMSVRDMRRNETDSVPFKAYRKQEDVMNVTIRALSCAPRVFEIPNFLSDVEVDHILELVKARSMRRSTTGSSSGKGESGVQDVRTSRNTWLPRRSSPILDAVYKRGADVLRIDEALFRARLPDEHPEMPTAGPLNEDLQVVHYDVTQEYTAHHDFGYPDSPIGDHSSRSINLCFYLNEGMEGGQTSFPRWRNGETTDSLDVTPEKGKAVIFYMVNPDGNLDDLTQHAALPVLKGEKWFANLWIWDPVRY